MEQQDLNRRLILALVLSFFVFVGYSYIFPPAKQEIINVDSVTKTEQKDISHPSPTQISAKTPANTQQTSTVAPVSDDSKILLNVKSELFHMEIDVLGRISKFTLLQDKYDDEDGKKLQILGINKVKPLELRFSDPSLNSEAFKIQYTFDGSQTLEISDKPKTIVLVQTLSTLTISKTITISSNGEYSIEVKTSQPSQYFITPGHRPMADDSMYMLVRGALIKGADDIITTIEDGDAMGDESINNAKIISAFDRYVASLFYSFEKGVNVSVLKEGDGDPLLFIEGTQDLKLGGYIGPKDYKILYEINPELTDAIEFGWFTFLSTPFFKILIWIQDMVKNWGWSIIIFTLLVKLVLFPLSYKGMMSMQKLKDLAPKMKDLKAKHKDDPAKMNAQMMEMYKKNGANPMGGCLPMLLQIPVFFALYRVLLNADEMQGATWLSFWINDLSAADPYYILPVLMGASMWFQQKITPNNFTDPLQEKIFQWFPVIMALMFIIMPFPSGLVLYWVVNNIFTIGQQYIINNAYAKHKAQAVKAHKKEKDSK